MTKNDKGEFMDFCESYTLTIFICAITVLLVMTALKIYFTCVVHSFKKQLKMEKESTVQIITMQETKQSVLPDDMTNEES